ncbi:unnamed protein product [Ascophyllum nodosum]
MKNRKSTKKVDRRSSENVEVKESTPLRSSSSMSGRRDQANGTTRVAGSRAAGNASRRSTPAEKVSASEESDDESDEDYTNASSCEEGDESAEEGSGSDSREDDSGEDSSEGDSGKVSGEDSKEDSSEEDSEEFEDQGSDSDDEEEMERQQREAEDSGEEEGGSDSVKIEESTRRTWSMIARDSQIAAEKKDGTLALSMAMHTDDLSSDDDVENRNTIGRVPLHWYDEYEHIGYDRSGGRVIKRADGSGNAIDAALNARDDPNYSRTVYDAYNDREVTLTDRELEVIRRIQAGAFPHPEFEAHSDYVDYVTHEKEIMPLNGGDIPKRRFVPSKWENMKVHQLMKGIREGRITVHPKTQTEEEEDTYQMWKDDDDIPEKHRGPMHIPAPKMPLPGHAESYRPPKEYLLTEEEQKQWEEMDPTERPTNFMPKSFDSLRQVGAYAGLVKERFERCLDLYLCPRAFKRRLNIDPESLVPRLPRPRELKPFPNALCVEYEGHSSRVRCISCSADGQWLASGDDDGVLILWEVDTARASRRFDLSDYGGGDGVGAKTAGKKTSPVKWEVVFSKKGRARRSEGAADRGEVQVGPRIVLRCEHEVSCVTWHNKGDYLASVSLGVGRKAVMVHQVSKASTQCPFRKTKGEVQRVRFHGSKPFLFVATKQTVRVYHLMKQMMVKKLISGCKWISSMDVHPSGDHLIVGSYDRRVVWFDLDLSSTPYKTLKYHTKAVRDARFHRHYPLMASASDDGSVHVFHSTVYSDLLRNPLIVPLKILRGHQVTGGIGVMALAFHPRQPWLFTAGADGAVRLFQDI